MAQEFPDAAADLDAALEAFDWRNQPRMNEQDLRRYYEHRVSPKNLQRLLAKPQHSVRQSNYLHAIYIGPAGCGKSTDLTWLTYEIEREPALYDQLFIVHYDIGEVVGTHNIGFAEVAMSMVLEVHDRLEQLGLPRPDERFLLQVERWLYGQQARTRRDTKSGGGGVELSLLKWLKLGLSNHKTLEQEVRVKVPHLLPQLLHLLEELFAEVEERTGKTLLFVVDDLEKISPVGTALGLFFDHGGFFADLPCHLLFTAPSSLRLDPRFTTDILRHFKEFRAVLGRPDQDGQEQPEFERLRHVIYRRIRPAIVDRSAVDALIQGTGGLLSHLVEGMERALEEALVAKVGRVELAHVHAALEELSQRFFMMLTDEDYRELDRVQRDGADGHVERGELLHNLSILEYPDSPTEFAVHPLVHPLLPRWRRSQRSS